MASKRGGCVRWFKHCLLVIEAVGLEACVGLEVIFMIANIQTLGVPIRYSSLPGTISAAFGMVLIPAMGFLMNKWARTQTAKAMILIGTCSLELMGHVLIFAANTIKLLYYDTPQALNGSESLQWDATSENNATKVFSTTNSSFYTQFTDAEGLNTTLSSAFMTVSGVTDALNEAPPPVQENVRYFAILGMIGFCLLDCGYDSSMCFLKTFALASTDPEDHSSVIVKSVFVSSFGGFLIAVLGSIGLGGILTAGTSHDASAAQTAFVAALCFVLIATGLVTSLSTGFCCWLSSSDDTLGFPGTSARTDEKSSLIVSENMSHDLISSQASRNSHSYLERSISGRFSAHALTSQHSFKTGQRHVVDHVTLSSRGGLLGFLIRQKKQILVNLLTFFMLGSLYSFEVYAVNFVGDGIFQGNPLAPVNSEDYQKYLKGIEVGSQGTLIYYITFTICTSINEILLKKIGWKPLIFVTTGVFIALNLVCAVTFSLWAYYAVAVWTGIFRTIVVTVPYILANKFALEEGTGQDSGVAIAMVAAMLPCGFTVCSAVMGPLIDATGNPATPLYYTAVTGFLGAFVTIFLKSD